MPRDVAILTRLAIYGAVPRVWVLRNRASLQRLCVRLSLNTADRLMAASMMLDA